MWVCFLTCGSRNHSVNSLLLIHIIWIVVFKSVYIFNVITCRDTLAVSSWQLCYKSDTDRWLPTRVASLNEDLSDPFFSDVIVGLTLFSQFEEYGIKGGKMQLHKIMNTWLDIRAIGWATVLNWSSCRNESMYVCLHLIKLSKCRTHHNDSCFFFCFILHLPLIWLLEAPDKAVGLIWVAAKILSNTKIFCTHSICVFTVCMSERPATFAQYFNRLVFITELESVHCAVRDGSFK